MRLDEFMARAHADLDAFADATRRMAQAEPENFDRDRTAECWWREVRAYHLFTDVAGDEPLIKEGR